MSQRIINWYKLKRKMKRGVRQTTDFFISPGKSHSRKDFAWHSAKRNPMLGKKGNEGRGLKTTIFLAITIALIMAVGIYHPFFRIKNVEVSGLQRINKKEFSQTVLGMINYNKLLVLPGNSYFVVNAGEIVEMTKNRFPIERVVVEKKFPSTLAITAEEKISTLIYDNGKEYSYLDANGNVVEKIRQVGNDEWLEKIKITTSTNESGELKEEREILERTHTPDVKRIKAEMGDYPIIFDKRGNEATLNNPAINQELAGGIIQWFNLLNKKTDSFFGYLIIADERGEGEITTGEGWILKVKLAEAIGLQFSELQHLLYKEKVNTGDLNYVDLRYLGKVFWK